MKIICENCGHELKNVTATSFSIEYVESYLAEYFNVRVIDIFTSFSYAPKTYKVKKVMCYILKKFTGKTSRELGERYGVSSRSFWLSGGTDKLFCQQSPDIKFIEKELAGELPTPAIVHHRRNN